MSGGVECLDAGTGRRLQDEHGWLVPLAPVVGELQGLMALGRPPGPLTADERPKLRGVKRRATPRKRKHEMSDALVDETVGQGGQLGTQLEHVPHQVRLTPHVLDQKERVMLPNIVGAANTRPQGQPRKLAFQPGGHRIVGGSGPPPRDGGRAARGPTGAVCVSSARVSRRGARLDYVPRHYLLGAAPRTPRGRSRGPQSPAPRPRGAHCRAPAPSSRLASRTPRQETDTCFSAAY